MNEVDNRCDEQARIGGLSDMRLKTGALSAHYIFFAAESRAGDRGNGRGFPPWTADPFQ